MRAAYSIVVLMALAVGGGRVGLGCDAASAQDISQQQSPPLRIIGVGFVRHAFGAWTGRIADGGFQTATGRNLRWLPHDTDSAVAAAFAAGKLDIAVMGASVAVSAAQRGIDLKILYVMGHSSTADGLVLSNQKQLALVEPKALQGKVIATPFGSTPHFRLLESIRRWGFSVTSMRLVNLQTSQIAEAWRRGEIDGAAVSEPLLGALADGGQPVALPEQPGHPGLLVLTVASEFATSHAVFLSRFVDVIARADLALAQKLKADDAEAGTVKSISFITGLSADAIANSITRYRPPALDEQSSGAWLGGGGQSGLAAELKAISEVLRWSGRLSGRDPDFAAMIAPEAVQLALTYK